MMSSLVLKWWYSDGGINHPSCRGWPPRWRRACRTVRRNRIRTPALRPKRRDARLNVADIDDFMVAQPW